MENTQYQPCPFLQPRRYLPARLFRRLESLNDLRCPTLTTSYRAFHVPFPDNTRLGANEVHIAKGLSNRMTHTGHHTGRCHGTRTSLAEFLFTPFQLEHLDGAEDQFRVDVRIDLHDLFERLFPSLRRGQFRPFAAHVGEDEARQCVHAAFSV